MGSAVEEFGDWVLEPFTGGGDSAAGARSEQYWNTMAEIAAAQYEFWETNIKPEIEKALPGIFEEMAQEREAARLERENRAKWVAEVEQAERDGRLDELYLEGLTRSQQEEWLKLEPAERENRLAQLAHLALERDEAAKWLALGDEERALRLNEIQTLGLQQEEAREWLGLGEFEREERRGQLTELADQRRLRSKYLPELEALADVPVEQLESQRAGEASANVEQALTLERQGTARRLGRMGVDVSSGAYAGQTRADEVNAAALEVSARNRARAGARGESYAQKSYLANYGSGLPQPPQPIPPPPAPASPVNFQPAPGIPSPTPQPLTSGFARGGEIGEIDRRIPAPSAGGTRIHPDRILDEPMRRTAQPSASLRVGEPIFQPTVKAPGDTRDRFPLAHGGRVHTQGRTRPPQRGRQAPPADQGMNQWALGIPQRAMKAAEAVATGNADAAGRQYRREMMALNALYETGVGLGAAGAYASRGGDETPTYGEPEGADYDVPYAGQRATGEEEVTRMNEQYIRQDEEKRRRLNQLDDKGADYGYEALEYYARGGKIGYAEGGEINGPGTETSDSIPATLEEGSYVINAEAVKRKGTDFFTSLLDKYTPDAENPVRAPGAAPGKPQMLASGGNAAIARWSYGLPDQAQRGLMGAAKGFGRIEDQEIARQEAKMRMIFGAARSGAMIFAAAADGGEITGDNAEVPVRLSDNEFVVPPQVVKAKGIEFFDKINFTDAPAAKSGGPRMGLPQALPI